MLHCRDSSKIQQKNQRDKIYSYNTQIDDRSLYWLGSFRAQTFDYIDGEMSHNMNNTDKVPSNDIMNKGWTDLS